MKSYAVLHIETKPKSREEILKQMPAFEAPSNYKDAAKIAEYINKKQEAWMEDAAFNAATGELCGWSIWYSDLDPTLTPEEGGAHPFITACLTDGTTERDLLIRLWDQLTSCYPTFIFRGRKFVAPFVSQRAATYKDVPSLFNMFAGPHQHFGYDDDLFPDIESIWSCGGLKSVENLSEITSALGIEYTTAAPGPFYRNLDNQALAKAWLENETQVTLNVVQRLCTPYTTAE
jgi:hypothetical protein